MKVHCQIDTESTGYLEHAMEEMNFSARAHDRILKVARTLADLAGAPNIRAADILEANKESKEANYVSAKALPTAHGARVLARPWHP